MAKRNRTLVKKALVRDKYLCQACGWHCNGHLEVHHIKALVRGGEDSLENMVTLCGTCHANAPESEGFQEYKDLGGATKQLVMGKMIVTHFYLMESGLGAGLKEKESLEKFYKDFEEGWGEIKKIELRKSQEFMKDL